MAPSTFGTDYSFLTASIAENSLVRNFTLSVTVTDLVTVPADPGRGGAEGAVMLRSSRLDGFH